MEKRDIQKFRLELVREASFTYTGRPATCPHDAYVMFNEIFSLNVAPEELMVMIALDAKRHAIGAFVISHGGISSTVIDIRSIFKRLFLCNASSFVIAHNHPSGNPGPSMEDLSVTGIIKEAARILKFELVDHIIIGGDSYLSLKEAGYF